MANHHFWLTGVQFERLRPLPPNKPRGVPRVDGRRAVSGIIHVLKNGLMWRDAPSAYAPRETLYDRFFRWSKAGAFNRIFAALATVLPALPPADVPIAGKGYDSSGLRHALAGLGIERLFGRLKDWWRIATRYDRCAHAFMSTIAIAATAIFWL